MSADVNTPREVQWLYTLQGHRVLLGPQLTSHGTQFKIQNGHYHAKYLLDSNVESSAEPLHVLYVMDAAVAI